VVANAVNVFHDNFVVLRSYISLISVGYMDSFRPFFVPGSPFGLYAALQKAVVPGKAVFVSDSGNGTVLAAEFLRLAGPRRFLAPTDFSSMGCLSRHAFRIFNKTCLLYNVLIFGGYLLGCSCCSLLCFSSDMLHFH
jgi:hypothetical protein